MKNKTTYHVVISLLIVFYISSYSQEMKKINNNKKITIGVVAKSQTNPVFIAAHTGALLAAKELGAKHGIEIVIDWQTPKNEDAQKQAKSIDKLSQAGVEGIAVACSDADALTDPIDKAIERGTEVVCFDADAPKSNRLAYYGSDNAEFGRLLMNELANEMNKKGTIAIIGGNKNAPNLQKRIQTVLEELKKYPNMRLLPNGIFYHEEIPEKAAEVMNNAQKANPEIGGWILIGGWPLFIKDAIKWEPGKIKIVACDALPNQLEYIKSGHVQTLLAQGCFSWGYKSVEILVRKIILNQKPEKEFIPDKPTRVTMDNLDEWSLNWKKWLLKEAIYR